MQKEEIQRYDVLCNSYVLSLIDDDWRILLIQSITHV